MKYLRSIRLTVMEVKELQDIGFIVELNSERIKLYDIYVTE